ncbi:anaphase-promoting complex component Cut20/Apc4 [Pseudomassariella vexata]|uniref:Anaphase-promoting complex subunit 4 n=1 Tax=Pseudomassariella vexata TaxID=1141098 RepID=A0A1Y2EF90_9PEZI|nr:anaphase-promoting complex component Cut20/Apc4 [Pseudomassariella vexata]ORY69465.1 anaphase-promoting complex component Cut20/Apc4 [Pseudomassariella vexata]
MVNCVNKPIPGPYSRLRHMSEPIQLETLGETRLDPKPHGELLTYNPSIELFARAAGPKSLQIWRSNGQVVVKSSQRGEKESVEALRWKTDGQFLAVAWSDGVVRLMGLENSKAVHQIPVCEAGKARITCMGWTRNFAGKRAAVSKSVASALQKLSLDDDDDDGEKRIMQSLPRELTFLEVETALPKISPLPASGGSGDDMYVFTTRASLEFLFRPFAPEDSDKVDVMIVGTNDGQIHLSIYDSFVIGSFNYSLPRAFGIQSPLELISHASHPELSTHSLVFKSASEDQAKALYLVPMDLTFVYSSPENLSLLASKTTTLQKLLRYVKQVQMHMINEWQSTRELPSRFLKSINETLSEAGTYGEMDIGPALYHTVVTGHTFPEVKEWLVDQLAERGHKRWDKAVVSGLESLRSLVHENFLPALERIAIILSRLLGIARFHESQHQIGFTSAQVTKVMDIVTCLILVGNKILLLVMEELDLFHCFSTWLRHEIDSLASSSTNEELTEKEATMEHGKVLTYIRQYLPASPLRCYLRSVPKEDSQRDWELAENGSSLLDMLDKQISKQESGQDQSAMFSQIDFLGAYLASKANVVFDGIAEAEKRSVRFGKPTKIELKHSISKFDVRMQLAPKAKGLSGVTFTALTQEQQESNVYIFRTETNITNGISGNVTTQVSSLTLGEAKVLDVKFIYEDSLLVLASIEDQLRIIRIPHQSADLGYRDYTAGTTSVTPHALSTEQVTSVFLNLIMPGDGGFMPMQMEVKEACSERGKFPARVCLLGDDLQTYRVLALPASFFGGGAGE